MISTVSTLIPRRTPYAELDRFLVTHAQSQLASNPLIPGFQCAVVVAGRPVVNRALGVADAISRKPLLPSHILQAASNAKPLAAVVAAILADREVLNLDTPISSFLGGWRPSRAVLTDAWLGRVTTRMLLSHTSGLGVRGYPQIPWRDPSPPSAPEIIDHWFGPDFAINDEPTPTGSHSIYSAAGFTLVQHVLESTTGEPYARLVERLIARPLRLKGLWVGRRDQEDRPAAALHDESGRALPRTFYPALASSGLYTSAADLAGFYAGFPRLLSPRMLEQVVRPHSTADNGWTFGLGFALADSNGLPTCKHAGWSLGCWGAAEGIPQRRTGVAVLTNSAAGKSVVMELLGAAVQWLTTH